MKWSALLISAVKLRMSGVFGFDSAYERIAREQLRELRALNIGNGGSADGVSVTLVVTLPSKNERMISRISHPVIDIENEYEHATAATRAHRSGVEERLRRSALLGQAAGRTEDV